MVKHKTRRIEEKLKEAAKPQTVKGIIEDVQEQIFKKIKMASRTVKVDGGMVVKENYEVKTSGHGRKEAINPFITIEPDGVNVIKEN